MNIKPIKSVEDNLAALARIEQLWDAKPGTSEFDELEVLSTLVDAFEEANCPFPQADPIEAIRFRMDQLGLEDKDLVPYLGTRSRVSEVLKRKRSLTLTMIRNLNKGLKISLDSLVRDYQLVK